MSNWRGVPKRLPKSKKINGKERIGIGRKIENRYNRWYDYDRGYS
ncbi:hypothetical protein [Clostridium tyrobutyricum]|nr:hypothetical protein [Clostridium tyrobutyricum]QCH29537.1 hypothetical protein EZN00_03175 [Clostridium tyrobutyricum]